jgi:hypothetical protein
MMHSIIERVENSLPIVRQFAAKFPQPNRYQEGHIPSIAT